MNLETMTRIKLPRINPDIVAHEIGDFIVQSVLTAHTTGAVIGLSGGVDSTTVAAIAQQAFDRYNLANNGMLELVGYILPSGTNNPADTTDGVAIAEKLGIRYEVHSIEPLVQAYKATNPEALENKFDRGNMSSRIRGTVLNTKASTERKTLLGTGNKDEDFGIGYYTLFGDGAVHVSPIGGLSKRLVKQMARHLGFSEIAYREPTAGLEHGQTDFKDLGYSYEFVELVTEGLTQGVRVDDLHMHSQVLPLFKQDVQRYASLFGEPKYAGAQIAIADMLKRHKIADAKAQIVHPPSPSITLSYE